MADTPAAPAGAAARPDREQLRADFLAQTAQITFRELQRPFAAGRLVLVDDSLDLVEVAVQLALDASAQFQRWIDEGRVGPVSDSCAARWIDEDRILWAVVAEPWVLVQVRESREQAEPSTLTESP